MEIVNPDLKSIVNELNQTFNEKLIIEKTRTWEELSKLRGDLYENSHVTLKNGESKQYKVVEVIPMIYNDIKEIKATIEPLSDFGKLHSIFKKYKLYYMSFPPFALWLYQAVRSLINHIR